MDVRGEFGDFRLKVTELVDRLAGCTCLRTYEQYLIAFCSRLEAAGDVVSCRFMNPIVLNRRIKLRDPRINSSGEIRPKAVRGGIFNSLFSRWLLPDRK